MALVAIWQWKIKQYDVKIIFLMKYYKKMFSLLFHLDLNIKAILRYIS